MMKYIKLVAVLLLVYAAGAQQTQAPFWNDIQQFKKQDSLRAPAPGQTLFIGSSSFTRWKDAQSYFPEHHILNRAFGGSTLENLIFYIKDIVYPYQPGQIVIYCGENDFAGDTSLTATQVAERFYTLFNRIREKYKAVPVAYVSMKPSPSRAHLLAKFNAANTMIKSFLSKQKNTAYIDVFHAMLNSDGTIRQDIFLEDRLHMNKMGYKIWTPLIKEKLVK